MEKYVHVYPALIQLKKHTLFAVYSNSPLWISEELIQQNSMTCVSDGVLRTYTDVCKLNPKRTSRASDNFAAGWRLKCGVIIHARIQVNTFSITEWPIYETCTHVYTNYVEQSTMN